MAGFAEEMAEVFRGAYPDQEGQECVRDDFRDLGAQETLEGFERAEHVLRRFLSAAEVLDYPLYNCLAVANERAREGRRVAERYAEGS